MAVTIERAHIFPIYINKHTYPLYKPGFHIIVSNVRIVSVTEFLVRQSGRKDRTIGTIDSLLTYESFMGNRKSVSIW